MIIKCSSINEALSIIEYLRCTLPNAILNHQINDNYNDVLLIIDGQIDQITNSIAERGHLNIVFNSLLKPFFFINNSNYNKDIIFGNRVFSKQDNLISVVAGPCEIESYDELYETASLLKQKGCSMFRAMPMKPRTSPYNYQGVGRKGFYYMAKIKEELDLPVLVEVFSQDDIDICLELGIDAIQIGSRNMQNYDLIKRAAKSGITTVLKKGMWCNNEQLLKAAEYFYVFGKGNVVLCERGIQTHESSTRNTFDISSILYLKSHCQQPIMADASHGSGRKEMISTLNCSAILAGADIIEVEVCRYPDNTIKPGDYFQILNIPQYEEMLNDIRQVLKLVQKKYDWEI